MQEIQFQSLGREDSLEKGMAAHSSILAWEYTMERVDWWVQSMVGGYSHKELDMT